MIKKINNFIFNRCFINLYDSFIFLSGPSLDREKYCLKRNNMLKKWPAVIMKLPYNMRSVQPKECFGVPEKRVIGKPQGNPYESY